MALHDFVCPDCATTRVDVHVPIAVGASHAEVYCPACDADLQRMIRMVPIPGIGRMSVFGEFAKTTVQVEDARVAGGFREVAVNTLGDIRRLEKESEQAERDGHGRKMIWRDYSQDASNKDVHTMGPDPSLRPSKFFSNGTPVKVRKGDPVTADHGTIEE